MTARPAAGAELREMLAREAHRAFHEEWTGPDKALDLYADSPIWTAIADALATVIAARQAERDRQQRAEALREAADEFDAMWNRGHDSSVHPYSYLLRDRADREAGTP